MSKYISDAIFSKVSTLVKPTESYLALYKIVKDRYKHIEYPKIKQNVNILHINLEKYFEKNLSLDHLKEGQSGTTIYVYIENGSIGQEITIIFTPIFDFTTLNIISSSGDNINITKYVSKIIFTGKQWENSWSSSNSYKIIYNLPQWSDYYQNFDSLSVGDRLVDSKWTGWGNNQSYALLIDNFISISGNSGVFNVVNNTSDAIFSLSNLVEGTYIIQFSVYAKSTKNDITTDRFLAVMIVDSGFTIQYYFDAHVDTDSWVKNILEIDYTNKKFIATYETNSEIGTISGSQEVSIPNIDLLHIYVTSNGTPTSDGAFYIDNFSVTKKST